MAALEPHETQPSEALVALEGVHVERGGREVLRGLSLELGAGDVFALLGGNGAGKSTTLLTCLGLIKPQSGTVTVLGQSAHDQAAQVRQRLAYLPEQAQLYPELDAYENLSYFLELAGLARSAEDIDAALDEVALRPEDRGRRLAGYSKGMRQKVAIALALLRRTRLLLLDEPTSGLDPLAVDEFDALVQRLGAQGVAVLMVTHDLYGASRVASRLGVLRDGRMEQVFERGPDGIDIELVRQAYAGAATAHTAPTRGTDAS